MELFLITLWSPVLQQSYARETQYFISLPHINSLPEFNKSLPPIGASFMFNSLPHVWKNYVTYYMFSISLDPC